jgi:type IV pilus assembly protein PilA
MNSQIKLNLLKVLSNKKSNKGFTLIELLVVVVIVGVLAAVALPNLLGQVGKARETEGKNGVGSINRTQQAYHFEKQTFSPSIVDADLEVENDLGVIVKSDYYDFAVTAAKSATDSSVATTAKDPSKDGVRNYSGGVNFATGQYTTVICQADKVGKTGGPLVAAPVVEAGAKCKVGDGTTIK